MTDGGSSSGTRRGPSPWQLYSLLCLMVTLWAVNFVIARYALREFPPLLAASLRAVSAALFLLPIYFWKNRGAPANTWQAGDFRRLIVMGILGVTLNQVLFLAGLHRTSTGHAAIMIGLTPLMVLVLSAITGDESLSARKIGGIAVSLLGIGVLQGERGSGNASLAGDLLIVAASATFAVFAVMSKRITVRHGGLTVNTMAYAGGSLFLLPLILWHFAWFDFGHVSAKAWLAVIYMGMFPSAICYLIFYYALTHIPASRVSNLGYLQPILATLFGVLLLGDSVNSALLAGGSLVLTGVFLTERG